MNIIESNLFNIVNTERPVDKSPIITLSYSQSNMTFSTIGAILEAQYVIGDNYLLFISEGTPYEEALHIILIDSELKIKDSLELSAPYTPGMLRNISIIQPDEIQFSFFNDEETWSLKVAQRPHMQLWGNIHPVKRKSPLFHKAWIILEKS